MPEYVYALHDFRPENEDEVEFAAGERVEIIEKDDMFGDGWWRGRNLAGKEGLFPVSYTATIPPSAPPSESRTENESIDDNSTATSPSIPEPGVTRSALQPLREESEVESPPILSPVPRPPPEATFLNGTGKGYESDVDADVEPASSPPLRPTSDGEMMRATMTDVQKAIEQLGRGGSGAEDHDGARSFSFASTREGDTETDDTDFDLSDLDGNADAEGAEDWHKNARRKLAAKARRAVQEAERLEAMMSGPSAEASSSARRAVAPPIEVEISDESDAEEELDFTRSSRFRRQQPPGIQEEDEEEDDERLRAPGQLHKETSKDSAATEIRHDTSNEVVAPPQNESEPPTAKAGTSSFPVFSPPHVPAAVSPPALEPNPQLREPSPSIASEQPSSLSWKPPYSTSLSPPPQAHASSATPSTAPSIAPAAPSEYPNDEQKRNSAPLPVNGQHTPTPASHLPHSIQDKHSSVLSSNSAPAMTIPQPSRQSTTSEFATSPSSELKQTHPSEWTLEQVLEWLKSKGFDQDVCDKFAEQEITGDVLLELDANVLKSEIGIMAYGKRIRIANAISDLRRPPSFEFPMPQTSPEHLSPIQSQAYASSGSGQGNGVGNGLPSILHSRSQSQSQQSQHSFPGTMNTALTTTTAPGYPQSIQSSLGSPVGHGPMQQQQQQYLPGYNGNGIFPHAHDMSTNGQRHSDTVSANGAHTDPNTSALGLGIGMTQNGRPNHLSLSPSDGALKDSAGKAVVAVPGPIGEDDRGHMSDGDITHNPTSMRRRIFGRSHDSAGSSLKPAGMKESPMSSPTVRDSDKDSTKTGTDEHVKVKDKDSTRDSSSLRSRHKPKKNSVDGKSGDRLSIFGGSFGGSLGKHRKPPPPAGEEQPTLSEKSSSSKFHLPKLNSSSVRKVSQHRSSVAPPDIEKSTTNVDNSLFKDSQERHTLRKRTSSAPNPSNGPTSSPNGVSPKSAEGVIQQGQSILEQIGEPDFAGWMRKRGERYNTWKLRYLVLKGPHLYCLRSNNKTETRLKGYIEVVGYKVTVDENIDPGKYGFRIDHDNDKTHYFSSEEKSTVREWMKAIMKATIGRDYSKPVVSSCNIPTIPLVVAQAMNPAPRPPSPGAREATQKAMLRPDTSQLSSRDARVLMGIPGDAKDQPPRAESFFSNDGTPGVSPPPPVSPSTPMSRQQPAVPPPRPSREMRRSASVRTASAAQPVDDSLINWANSHLPEHLQISDPTGPLCGGLALLRLAESIRGRPSSPPVPDSAFPTDPHDDKLDGLFRLFDFLLDNDVKMGSVSINDVRQGKRDKIVQLLKALKSWEEKRKAIANSIVKGAAPSLTGYMPMVR